MTEQRTAIVTGASRGIGSAVAKRLAADGLAVTIGYAARKDEAEAVAAEIESSGGSAIICGGDIGELEVVEQLFTATEEQFGGVDVLVNSAGVMKLSSVADLDLEVFDAQQRTNVRGAFLLAREATRRMRPGGAIINFSSTVTRTRFPNYAAYAATKASMEVLSTVLAKELRGRDITVNTVAPGPTSTELFLTGKDEETIQRLKQMNPFGRLGEPEDIAEVVAALAGSMRWVNGQTIFANAGMA